MEDHNKLRNRLKRTRSESQTTLFMNPPAAFAYELSKSRIARPRPVQARSGRSPPPSPRPAPAVPDISGRQQRGNFHGARLMENTKDGNSDIWELEFEASDINRRATMLPPTGRPRNFAVSNPLSRDPHELDIKTVEEIEERRRRQDRLALGTEPWVVADGRSHRVPYPVLIHDIDRAAQTTSFVPLNTSQRIRPKYTNQNTNSGLGSSARGSPVPHNGVRNPASDVTITDVKKSRILQNSNELVEILKKKLRICDAANRLLKMELQNRDERVEMLEARNKKLEEMLKL